MNIKLKAALDTAAVVGGCLAGGALFTLGLQYAPWLTLAGIVAALTVIIYRMNLKELEMKEKYSDIYKEEV